MSTTTTPDDPFTPQPPHVSPLAEGLTGRGFTPAADAEGNPDAATAAFARAMEQGFYQPYLSDEQLSRVYQAYFSHGPYCYGVYPVADEPAVERVREHYGFHAEYPVATWADFDKTLNTGVDLLPARLITGVTVNAAYRRRGILRHMMTHALARAVTDGAPVAALTASEGGIYGRFGFGVAAREAHVEVNTAGGPGGFELRTPPTGRVVPADPSRLEAAIAEVWEGFHRRTRGSVDRQQVYTEFATARLNVEEWSTWNRSMRAAIHVRADGRIGGIVWWTHAGWETEPTRVEVRDLLAVDETSHRELWRYLASLDLADQVRATTAVEDPAPWAARNPRSWRVTRIKDVLWIRVLNPVTALQSRQWGTDGEFSLSLTDPMGIASGVFTVSVSAGVAQVSSSQSPTTPQHISLDIESLGSLYLGDVSVLTLRDAGRITAGEDLDWAALSATVDLKDRPFCATHF
ncbi:GNAT family N-acetyltransferase [Nesterenkonia alba]|uniref:GNAT family N-acetyltransferase n=1 Tax=Nesterenkonia alba TaxID=515814 RepID=UPI0004231130|nr:GNAT family N-acetyltransferase [Nesterenkonia alba]